MKKFRIEIVCLLCLLLFFGINHVSAIEGTGDTSSTDTTACGGFFSDGYQSCWFNERDMGFRFTFVDSNGNILSNTKSMDYFSDSSEDQDEVKAFLKSNDTYYKKYKKSNSSTVKDTKRINIYNMNTINSDNKNNFTESKIIKAFSSNNSELFKTFFKDSGASNYYVESEIRKYYIVIEPIYLIGYRSSAKSSFTYKMGTATEIAAFLKDHFREGLSNRFLSNAAFNLYLDENKLGFKNVKSSYNKFCSNSGCRDIKETEEKSLIANVADTSKGYGMYIIFNGDIEGLKDSISCPISVEINECGNSTIMESTDPNCVKENEVYSYLPDCNLYCADRIETNFSNFYKTFIGNNKLKAIESGKYQSIKGNPKITITKTCYQSASSKDCPNVAESFEFELNRVYKTNNIILNVDGNSYTLIGTPEISRNGHSSATITYEYRLDDNVNKYINIESLKGVTSTNIDEKKVIINGAPMIITSKESYGTYKYNLDVSGTALNKYISSGGTYRKFKAQTNNDKYIFNNTISITYNNKTKQTYTNSNLKYSCSYKKYNTEDGCICPENVVCNPITCEPVVDSSCECNSQYGCLDDEKCTSIKPDLNPDKDSCNPEDETCFPNVVYRPISLTNPFPGIKGNPKGRTPGLNWIGMARDEKGKLIYYKGKAMTLKDYYITYNRGYNDYDVYQAKPLYVIKLDADTIKYIRKYNDEVGNNYNNFDLTCENGEKCISNFLRGTTSKAGYNRNLLDPERSECYRSDSFESCVKRKGD